ncbi:MAG: BrxA/BrxB family bacilliredoxin [Bacteroidetes bacterium]|nr:BrxA/BrxB family bacilliredoxin [Bacteroidota bacterium]
MYPEEIVLPMRAELSGNGFTELTTPQQVRDFFIRSTGTALVFVNSTCGCTARSARPAVLLSLANGKKPDYLTTVFAGVDPEATAEARKYMLPYPPSSPSIALFKDGRLVHFLERHEIEGKPAELIASDLTAAYEKYC